MCKSRDLLEKLRLYRGCHELRKNRSKFSLDWVAKEVRVSIKAL